MDVDACTEYRAILYREIIFYGNIRNVSCLGSSNPRRNKTTCFFPVHCLTAKEDICIYYLSSRKIPQNKRCSSLLYTFRERGGGWCGYSGLGNVIGVLSTHRFIKPYRDPVYKCTGSRGKVL